MSVFGSGLTLADVEEFMRQIEAEMSGEPSAVSPGQVAGCLIVHFSTHQIGEAKLARIRVCRERHRDRAARLVDWMRDAYEEGRIPSLTFAVYHNILNRCFDLGREPIQP